MAKRVRLQQEDDIAIIELCSPPGNLTDQIFFTELTDILEILQKDDKSRGIIVRGAGRHFSSGASINELVKSTGENSASAFDETYRRSVSTYDALARLSVPVVAAIQGCCLGSGMEFALACHYRVAVPTALFAMPELGYGLMPGCGGTVRLPKLIGVGRTIEVILGGRSFLAEDALNINLIDVIVKKKILMETAKKLIYRASDRTQ